MEYKHFSDLSLPELYSLLRLRNAVFVVEQTCAYQDIDEKDLEAIHALGWMSGELVAYARLLPPGISYPEPSIGRVLTAKSHRGQGLGRELMMHCVVQARHLFPGADIHISAQAYLESFYRDLGFRQVGEGYLEDNIPHIPMRLTAG